MFKDYDKYLTASLKVYLFVLICIFIMKLVGLDYFGIDANNYIIKEINKFLVKYNITEYLYFIVLIIYQYLMMSIICRDNSKEAKKFTLYTKPFTAILQHLKSIYINNPAFYILEFLYLIIVFKIYNKNVKVIEIIKKLLIIFVLQFISNITRNTADIQ